MLNRINSENSQDRNESNNLPLLIGDKRRLKQVLINLVKNAIKFTSRGSITIKSCYNAEIESLVVHVQDTGVGIAPEDAPTLFSQFGKLTRTAEMNHEGIGLGLTIVKQIVETSGGFVDCESEGYGRGSCFFFSMRMRIADTNVVATESSNDENFFQVP